MDSTRIMFYKGHVIRDTSLIFVKIKGQGLVNSEKLRDSFSYLLPHKVADSNWYILSPGLLSSNQETFKNPTCALSESCTWILE